MDHILIRNGVDPTHLEENRCPVREGFDALQAAAPKAFAADQASCRTGPVARSAAVIAGDDRMLDLED